ncbi:MAG TPA: Crp/Fnr family transcriptional regulator [Thermoanaerobaculia bacterium]
MSAEIEGLLRAVPMYRRLSAADRTQLAAVSRVETYAKGQTIFPEGDAPRFFCIVARGRVKVFKTTPAGRDVILEVFGAGDPFGAVAVYEGRPYPATAVALEETVCILTRRDAFLALLEQSPSFVKGLLSGLTLRLVDLTNRLAELTGGRVEPRFARLFLKLADERGAQRGAAVFIPAPLSRQELADLTGTTIETCIRIMSRWGKEGIVSTEKEGFTVLDRGALETLAQS